MTNLRLLAALASRLLAALVGAAGAQAAPPAPGFDSMSGLGSPAPGLIAALAKP